MSYCSSSSGKTQLALQLSLLVQVDPTLGGVLGSACYLTTHATLPTKRLAQISEEHALLSPSICSLSDVHTMTTPTHELLMHALSVTLPALQKELVSDPHRKPIKLIVIDSISALFHTAEKHNSSTLIQRSKALVELSAKLHTLASLHNIAIVVINDVSDVFTDSPHNSQCEVKKTDIIYRDQARWFGSAHSLPGENMKEAGLGLVWANQVNARIMLTRTNRRRHLDEPASQPKRRRLSNGNSHSSQPLSPLAIVSEANDEVNGPILVRRLSIVFSSVSARNSVDFVITKQGISVLPDKISPSSPSSTPQNNIQRPVPSINKPYDEGQEERNPNSSNKQVIAGGFKSASINITPSEPHETIPSTFPEEEIDLQDSDGDAYWAAFDDFPYDAFSQVDFDAVDNENVETNIKLSQM